MSYNHISLDIETLGTRGRSVILQASCVAFNREGNLGPSFDVFLNVDEQTRELGRTVDWSTIDWWFGQSEAARDFQTKSDRVHVLEGLLDLKEWVLNNKLGKSSLWGFGPAFDNAQLNDLYKDINVAQPFHYRADSCLRTLKLLYPHLDWPVASAGNVAHNSLHDATEQARYIQTILQYHYEKTGIAL